MNHVSGVPDQNTLQPQGFSPMMKIILLKINSKSKLFAADRFLQTWIKQHCMHICPKWWWWWYWYFLWKIFRSVQNYCSHLFGKGKRGTLLSSLVTWVVDLLSHYLATYSYKHDHIFSRFWEVWSLLSLYNIQLAKSQHQQKYKYIWFWWILPSDAIKW